MTTNRPEFKAHDDFIFKHKKVGKVTREEFIQYIRSSHEHMRKLSELIQQYNQTIDEYLNEWDGRFESFDDDVKDLLGRWIQDGTMDHIINENLMSIKADKSFVNEELEKVTAQLAQKVDQVLVDESTIKFYANGKNIGSFSLAEAGNASSVQDYIETLVSNGQIEGVRIGERAVDPENTTFFIRSENLFDKTKVESGQLDELGGGVYSNNSYVTSEFQEIDEGVEATLSTAYRIAFYDSNQIYISGIRESAVTNYTFTTPPSTAYIRYSVHSSVFDSFMFVLGNKLPDEYVPGVYI